MRSITVEGLEPGLYIILGFYRFFIEKDSDGIVHQLNYHTGERHGVLSEYGRNKPVVDYIKLPFVRKQ